MLTQTRRQKEVLEFITNFIQHNGYRPSYRTIAKSLGINSKGGIAQHIDALESQGLLTRVHADGGFNLEIHSDPTSPDSVARIGWLNIGDQETQGYFLVPQFMIGVYAAEKIFAFRVPDDGMRDECICEGDIALIKERSMARDSDSIVAVIDGRKAVLRKYYRIKGGIELRPANDDYEPRIYPSAQIEIRGMFRGLLRPIR